MSAAVRESLENTDWELLAEQKKALVVAIGVFRDLDADAGYVPSESAEALEGILHWIDALQDAAELDGLPVVFLTEEENG